MEGNAPWGHETDDTPQFGQAYSVPLQFHALYLEARPVDGKIHLSQLERLLTRMGLGETETGLLMDQYASSSSLEEQKFYEVLHAAAMVQDSTQDPANVRLNLSEDQGYENDQYNEQNGDVTRVNDIGDFTLVGERALVVEIKPQKEGMWGFKHTVYIIQGKLHGQQALVSRRYSDFVWLLDYLVKRYTFRVLPVLPPKRIQINGHYLSGDSSQFLARRRLGLARFLNLLAFHPVVSSDTALKAFLTDSSPMDIIKSRYGSSVLESPPIDELSELKPSPLFISQFNETKFNKWLASIQSSNERTLGYVTALCRMFAQEAKRYNMQASNACNMTMDFEGLRGELNNLYPDNKESVPAISSGVNGMAKYFEKLHTSYLEVTSLLQGGTLEDLKYYRDVLLSLRELLKRYRIFGGNTVLQLKSRIERTQAKIESLHGNAQAQDTVKKLREKIEEHQTSVKFQINRSWLIKEVMTQELRLVQVSQFQISKALRNFGSFRVTVDRQFEELGSTLFDQVSDLPLK